MEKLIYPLIEAESLHEILQEEKQAMKLATNPEHRKAHKKRIKEAKQLNKRFLTLLN
jgi:hypothetical protein